MIRRPPRSTQSRSSAASDVYKRQTEDPPEGNRRSCQTQLTIKSLLEYFRSHRLTEAKSVRPTLRTRLQRDRARISARITPLHLKYRFMPRRSSPTDSASRRYLLY